MHVIADGGQIRFVGVVEGQRSGTARVKSAKYFPYEEAFGPPTMAILSYLPDTINMPPRISSFCSLLM